GRDMDQRVVVNIHQDFFGGAVGICDAGDLLLFRPHAGAVLRDHTVQRLDERGGLARTCAGADHERLRGCRINTGVDLAVGISVWAINPPAHAVCSAFAMTETKPAAVGSIIVTSVTIAASASISWATLASSHAKPSAMYVGTFQQLSGPLART